MPNIAIVIPRTLEQYPEHPSNLLGYGSKTRVYPAGSTRLSPFYPQLGGNVYLLLLLWVERRVTQQLLT